MKSKIEFNFPPTSPNFNNTFQHPNSSISQFLESPRELPAKFKNQIRDRAQHRSTRSILIDNRFGRARIASRKRVDAWEICDRDFPEVSIPEVNFPAVERLRSTPGRVIIMCVERCLPRMKFRDRERFADDERAQNDTGQETGNNTKEH